MTIDRIGPTARPSRKNSGTQRWRDLLFMHWPVAVDELRALVPKELELDLYEGQAFVGLVPFSMLRVRPSWLPALFAFNFLETNVRVYVHHQGRPGVYFFSLEAASWLAVKAARIGWGLPYYYAKMRAETDIGGTSIYSSKRRSPSSPKLSVEYRVGEELSAPAPGSLEFFLLERYLLFSEHRGKLKCGQVHHSPYPVRQASVNSIEESLISAAGLTHAPGLPPLVHYSEGVDVEVFAMKTLPASSQQPLLHS